MSFGEPSLLHHPRSGISVRVKFRQVGQLNRSTCGVVVTASRSESRARGSREVKQSDLAGPGASGDVGAPVSAHLTDEPRPDLTQDGSPVQAIIPEMCKHVGAGLADLRGGGQLASAGLAPPGGPEL